MEPSLETFEYQRTVFWAQRSVYKWYYAPCKGKTKNTNWCMSYF